MRFAPVCALGLALLASSAGAQDQQALVRLIDESFAVSGQDRVADFLAIARLQGLIRNDDEATVAKEIFQARIAGEAAGYARTLPREATHGAGSMNPAGGNDVECNDTIGFADPLNVSSGSCTVIGATGGTDLRDVYFFRLPAPGEWLVSATMTGTTTTCNLFDDVGRLVVVGLANGAVRGVSKIILPAGTYYINAVGTAYTLTVTAAPAVCPTLAIGPNPDTVNPAGLAAEVFDVRSWKFIVPPGHSDVDLAVASVAGLHNLFFNLGRGNAGRIHFCDAVTPAPANPSDPVMKAGLPAGTYYLYVQNQVLAAVAPIPYTVTMAQTPIIPRNLCGPNNYTFTNSGHRDLFALRTVGVERVTIATGLGTVPPAAMDSYIELFDADMGLLSFNDDGCALTPCTPGFRSYLDVTLPPGLYYLTFRGFAAAGSAAEFGDYAVDGTCALPTTVNPIGARRAEPFAIAAGTHAAFAYGACTDQPVSVSHNNNVFLVDRAGKLRGSYQQLVSPGSTTLVGHRMLEGERLFLIERLTNQGGATTAATIFPAGQLGIQLAPISPVGVYSLVGEEKVTQLHALFLSVGQGPSVPILSFGGKLCLDIPTLTFLTFHSYSANCRQNFGAAPYLFPDLRPFIEPITTPGLRFQALSLDTTFNGAFTNIAQ